MKQHRNLFVDICNMAEQNKDKYRKVYDDMYALRETWVDVQRKEGKIEGFEKGFEEAFEEGFKEGFEEGKIEGKIEIVLNMINKNFDDEFIVDLTDFSLKEIAKIREEHSNK